ncbi:hypothetical protein T05_12528 [Trichinella murrelli]|uniref:Uncharacterized protein n=1 Tax=Trichinella murrelli TaxID=144512 RepID=A0A0V0U1C2_9BILA|nr:hypothetical protein T05_12528 [Trichinella murrelli]
MRNDFKKIAYNDDVILGTQFFTRAVGHECVYQQEAHGEASLWLGKCNALSTGTFSKEIKKAKKFTADLLTTKLSE